MNEDILSEVDRETVDRCSGNLPSMAEVEMLVEIIDRLESRVKAHEKMDSISGDQSVEAIDKRQRDFINLNGEEKGVQLWALNKDIRTLLDRVRAADSAVEKLTTALAESEVRVLGMTAIRDSWRRTCERTKHELDEITASHARQSEWLRRLQRVKNEAHSVGYHEALDATSDALTASGWVDWAALRARCPRPEARPSETLAERIIEESYAAARCKYQAETTGIRGVHVTDVTQDLESTSGVIPRAEARPAEETCTWAEGSDGEWSSECGACFILNFEGPDENGINFCLRCGKPVHRIPTRRR